MIDVGSNRNRLGRMRGDSRVGETFEECIRRLTNPVGDQYPRPWMTDLTDPLFACVFIVGHNQAKPFCVRQVGSHDRFMDALFNRNGQSCRGLYNEITGQSPSPTRCHLDNLTARLKTRGVDRVLETNVVCYSTAMSDKLQKPEAKAGREAGQAVFRSLIEWIRPSVLIVHGAGTTKELGRLFGIQLPAPPTAPETPVPVPARWGGHQPRLWIIPSLAPPGYNKWQAWSAGYLDRVADAVAAYFRRRL